MSKQPIIGVIGAGLAGSMVALLLAKLDFTVYIFEKRPKQSNDDNNNQHNSSAFGTSTSAIKRSINLALSGRGIAALKELNLVDIALKNAVPMTGRVIHNNTGTKEVRQMYGTKNQALQSVSRQDLNELLLSQMLLYTDKIQTFFGYTLLDATKDGHCIFSNNEGIRESFSFDLVIGADGAYSALRDNLLKQGRVDFQREYIGHGYKELTIPAAVDPATGAPTYALSDYQGLHIWPRKEFMLIALPNADKSFTATLFAPYKSASGGFDRYVRYIYHV